MTSTPLHVVPLDDLRIDHHHAVKVASLRGPMGLVLATVADVDDVGPDTQLRLCMSALQAEVPSRAADGSIEMRRVALWDAGTGTLTIASNGDELHFDLTKVAFWSNDVQLERDPYRLLVSGQAVGPTRHDVESLRDALDGVCA